MSLKSQIPIQQKYKATVHQFYTFRESSNISEPLELTQYQPIEVMNIGKSNVNIYGDLNITGDILPFSCNVYDLGSSNYRWRDLYLSGNTIDLGGTRISRNNATGGMKISSKVNDTPLDFTAQHITALGTLYASNITIAGNALMIEDNGNVGMGTAIPTQKLDVRGNIYASGNIVCSNISVIGDFVRLDTITSNTEQMVIQNAGTGPALKVTQSGANSVAEFYDSESGLSLTIVNGGNVGIGTNAPLEKLHIVGTARATTFSGSGASLTSLPAASLSGTVPVANGGTGANTLASKKLLVGNGTAAVLQPTNLHWDTQNDRLGIGSVSPSQALDVIGTVKATSFVSDYITGSNIVIGTSTVRRPGYAVNVYGGGVSINTSTPLLNSQPQLQTNGYDFVIYDDTNRNTISITPYVIGDVFTQANNEHSIYIPYKSQSSIIDQYLYVPYGSAAAINQIFASDFTLESFIYVNTFGQYNGECPTFIGYHDPLSQNFVWSFGPWPANRTLSLRYTHNSGTVLIKTDATLNLSTWYHIAMVYVKSTNALTFYINGTLQTLQSNAGNIAGATTHTVQGTSLVTGVYNLVIGQWNSQSLGCYVSNLRIVQGSAIVPSATPTAPIAQVLNTKLLLKTKVNSSLLVNFGNNRLSFGTSSPSSSFQIAETTASALAVNTPVTGYRGSPNTLMNITNCGLAYVDETGTTAITSSSLTSIIPTNFSPGGNAFSVLIGNFGALLNNNVYNGQINFTSSWTLDSFVYYTQTPISANATSFPYLMAICDYGGAKFSWGFGMNNNSKLAFGWKNSSSVNQLVETTNTLSINTWYHIAVTHDNSAKTLKLYINGTLQSLTSSGTSYSTSSATLLAEAYPVIIGSYSTQYNRVYISEMRISTAVVTPSDYPTAPQSITANTNFLLRTTASDAGGATLMNILKNGNVGIGTNNPTVKLDVNGDIKTSGSGIISTKSIYDNNNHTDGPVRFYSLQSGTGWMQTSLQLCELNLEAAGTGTMNSSPSLAFHWRGRVASQLRLEASGRIGVYNNPGTGYEAFACGGLSKSAGTFDISHPTKSNTHLVHSFIEGPRCDLIYRGRVTLNDGQAYVNIDRDCTAMPECAMTEGTFIALVCNPDFFLQNTTSFERLLGTLTGNILHISCENTSSIDVISWMVIGERKDAFIKDWNRTNEQGYLQTEYDSTI